MIYKKQITKLCGKWGEVFVETCKPCFSNWTIKTSNNIIRRDVEDREIEFARDFNDNVQQHHH